MSMSSMFGSNGLSLPSTFPHEHRPLRLSSENARPQPTGECRYLLQHPSAQNQRCSCQFFHHNRSAPGNICECGHQACYHLHEINKEKPTPEISSGVIEKLNLMADRMKRIEETVQNERGNRETALQRERQTWESDIRILREALAPFYNSEKDMRRKLMDIEDRLEGNYDEQVRLRERVVSVDDLAMSIDKRLEELEGQRSKRRRIDRPQGLEEAIQNANVSSDNSVRRVSSSIDEKSVHTPSSRALSPMANGLAPPTNIEVEEPRSSGILNLVEVPRSAPFNFHPRLSPPQDEPRSSGFLTIDLADRMVQKAASERGLDVAQRAIQTPPQDKPSPPGYARSDPELPRASRTPPEVVRPTKLPLIDVMVLPPINTSPRKRKYHLDHLALDVLADVSVASPLIH